MIVLDLEQGTPDWIAARLGIPTASRFADILTPKTRKASASQGRYLCELLAERLTGYPANDITSDFMARGTSLEAEAAAAYEFDNDRMTEKVGFVLDDARRVGCSPDRLVGDDGLLEIKCLSVANHVAAVLGMKDSDHFAQVQGQLWLTGRAWADLFFYNPAVVSHTIRIERDEDFIAALSDEVDAFCVRLDEAQATIVGGVAADDDGPDAPAGGAAMDRRSNGSKDAQDAVGATPGCGVDGTDAAVTDDAPAATLEVTRPLSDIERARLARKKH